MNFDNIINHYQILNYNYSNTIETLINNNNIKLINNINQTSKDKLDINKNANINTISYNNIKELTKMIANITLKYKNINKKEVSYESEDVDTKIQKGYRYPIYPNVIHGDTMYNEKDFSK